jgi:hypothetical protein
VGHGEEFEKPSQVASLVGSGDTVEIAAGTYDDSALWPRGIDGLTIEGKGATFSGRSCSGKAIFVVQANNVLIRGITFRNAKVASHNGAGIRVEGLNITVENSAFIDNEIGILGGRPGGTIVVRNSHFEGNGVGCVTLCGHGLYANYIALLRVEGSVFVNHHRGHHIKSRALRTEIVNNRIEDGPTGNSSYLVDISNGGEILIAGNKLEKGALSENFGAAIMIGEEVARRPANPTPEIRVENNYFTNDLARETVFVANFTRARVLMTGNTILGPVVPVRRLGS